MHIFSRVQQKIAYELKQHKRMRRWREADIYIISFPKSGRTWAHFLLNEYFSCAKSTKPKVVFGHRGLYGDLLEKQRKGNMLVDRMKEKSIPELHGKKVVLLVRDPRDVVVSHFFSMQKRSMNEQLGKEVRDMGLSSFIQHPMYGIGNIVEYMNVWYQAREVYGSFHLVRYEDCRSDPNAAFAKLVQFITGNSSNEECLQHAIDATSFDSMRKKEEEGKQNATLRPGVQGDKESYKTRRGKVGGFSEYFSQEDIAYANATMSSLDPAFGYPSS